MQMFLLLILNILFIFALWHMDVNHTADRLGEKKSRGVFKISPEEGYRYSQYGLIICLILLDLLFLYQK